MTLTHICCDWHIHTCHSPCGHAAATFARVAAGVEAGGITMYGFADHLHSPLNVPALREARRAFDALPPSPHRYFGVEVSCLREHDLAILMQLGEPDGRYGAYGPRFQDGPNSPFTLSLPDDLAFDYVIGSAHWATGLPASASPEEIIRCLQRQYLYLAAHPRVDIIAHPWQQTSLWPGHAAQDAPRFAMRDIPHTMHDEFAAAVREGGKAIEINAGGMLLDSAYSAAFRAQYLYYLAFLKSQGIRFTLGSDSHAADYHQCLPALLPDLQTLGLDEDGLWHPSSRGVNRS